MGEVPELFVTVTDSVPRPAGAVAVIEVGDTTVTLLAGVDPKSTVESAENPDPVIVTVVPPLAGPEEGEMLETTGIYPKVPAFAVCPSVVTTTDTAVPVPGGDVTLRVVPPLLADTFVAAIPPNVTAEAEVNPAPLIVT